MLKFVVSNGVNPAINGGKTPVFPIEITGNKLIPWFLQDESKHLFGSGH